MNMPTHSVALIGTGNIANEHAAALKTLPGVRRAGVFDVNRAAAERFAANHGFATVFDSIEQLAASDVRTVHVATPPDLHLSSALAVVDAGKAVLIEKPVAVSSAQCAQLAEHARRSGALVAVNQNMSFNPAFVRLKKTIEAGVLGRPRFVDYVYESPLRQLAARQFSHWMFAEPINILLEQAVHPLSQIVSLAGRVQELNALVDDPIEIVPGVGLTTACQVSMRCERLPVALRFHVGATFTVCRMTVVCDDGVAVADIFANQFFTHRRTKYLDAMDGWLSSKATARELAGAGRAGLRDYALSMIGAKPRADAFFIGMRDSVSAFHGAVAAGGTVATDLSFGAHLVDVCERIAKQMKPLPARAAQPVVAAGPAPAGALVTVLGGTGFIGGYTVAKLLDNGFQVRVMARGTRNLQPVFSAPGVTVVRGDVKRAADVEQAVAGAAYVINLAHGGGGADYAAIHAALVDSAMLVAKSCANASVKRLVHVGSIAGLYLGDPNETITGATPPDPLPETRNDYARAKASADNALLALHRQTGLSIVLLRPGVVMGAGTSPFHGGLGFFNNDQYCIGWNRGDNPLPWVLVEDCADAIVRSLRAEAANGKAYNLVGDVRPSASEFIRDLSAVTGRPLRFCPSSPTGLWLVEMGKWLIKRIAGRQVTRPYRRDLLSRGLAAKFDCSDAKRDLGWTPQGDPQKFHQQAVAVHAQ